MSKVVCRVQKIKSFSKIGKASNHNYRYKNEVDRQHLDLSKSNLCIHGSQDLLQDCKNRLDQADKNANGKFRTNAVLAVEMILSASPDFFNNPEKPEILDQWIKANVAWLKDQYGPNFVNAVVHLDEQTPHIHAIIIPIDDRNKLNCRCILGGRDTLKLLQDNSHEAVKHLGLERGTPKDITGATHKKTAEWRKEQLEIDLDKKSLTKAIDKVPVIETNFTKLIHVDKAHEYYTKKTKEAVKKATPNKILSLTNDNKDLKEQELLHRKAKDKANAEKEIAEKLAEEQKLNAEKSEEILIETTKIYEDSLKVAEKNAYKIALDFLQRPENKSKLEVARKATPQVRIKIAKAFEIEMQKEFELKNISKEDSQKAITKMRDKVNNIEKKKDKGLSI